MGALSEASRCSTSSEVSGECVTIWFVQQQSLLILLVSQQHVNHLPLQRDLSEVGQCGSLGRSLFLRVMVLKGFKALGAAKTTLVWCKRFSLSILDRPCCVCHSLLTSPSAGFSLFLCSLLCFCGCFYTTFTFWCEILLAENLFHPLPFLWGSSHWPGT